MCLLHPDVLQLLRQRSPAGGLLLGGLLLVVIGTTPSLRTKTNKILASLTASDLATGLSYLYYIPYSVITTVVNDPCKFNVANVATRWTFLAAPYSTCCNMVVVAIDRYVAIVHPLHYETKITDAVVYGMIAAAWFIGISTGSISLFWLINADVKKCPILPARFAFADAVIYAAVTVIVSFLYGRILFAAWHQHVAVAALNVAPSSGRPQSNVTGSGSATAAEQQSQVHKTVKSALKIAHWN
jgi:hypothetical protein